MQTPNITALHVNNFRNIESAVLDTPLINIISGANGSGKSSLLEALYYLSHFKARAPTCFKIPIPLVPEIP